MQLLLEESEEFGITTGLGLIPGRVVPVPTQSQLGIQQKIPHIGWNTLLQRGGSSEWEGTLLHNNLPGESVYFVHSFMAVTKDPAHSIATCLYGGNDIVAVIVRDQITGCQFHPEKSGDVGLKILNRFCLT
jgi:glutamine amidotransferase